MNNYLVILKYLLKAEHFNKYQGFINKIHIKENYPDIYKLYLALYSFPEGRGDLSIYDLSLQFYSLYPNAKKEVYDVLLREASEANAADETISGVLSLSKQREQATVLARNALEFAEGKKDLEQVTKSFQDLSSESITEPLEASTSDDFVTDDLHIINSNDNLVPGLLWPLQSLNEVLGPLRKGDFGFLFARPETGKTTFLVHVVTHMAQQTDRPILWFNNEEKGTKVMKRCYQALFGITLTKLLSNITHYVDEYKKKLDGRILIKDEARVTKLLVETACKKYNPSLIIFDQIDKVAGFEGERYDLQMKSLYQWARELAKTYAPVIGVCQAGGTAENKKFLQMTDVDSSHTAKQGEADWMLGIGKIDKSGLEEVRYLAVPKNKLDGDPQHTKEERRHDKWEVRIIPEHGQYADY